MAPLRQWEVMGDGGVGRQIQPAGGGGGGGGAPEPGVGDTILFTNDFNQTTLTNQLAVFDDNGPSGFARVTPGRAGSAACLQIQYTPSTPGPVFGFFIAATQDCYCRWYFRIQSGWLPYSGATGSGFKWFLPKRAEGQPRYTDGVGELTGGPAGFENTGYEFTTHDQSSDSPNPVMSNIDKSIRFETVNDGNWHKATYRTVTDDGTGHGFEQVWIDDVRILDTRIGQPGVPAGGWTHNAGGIENLAFGDLVVDGIPDSSWSGTIDYDDMVCWHT